MIDLLKVLAISYEEFDSCRRILEAFGLIKTYVSFDEINNIRSYLLEIEQPLSFPEFILNNKFKKSFINQVGIQKFQELEFYYNSEVNSKYKKVSDNYDDIFTKFETSNEYVFDFQLLTEKISTLAKDSVIFDDETKKLINFYFTSFSVSLRDIEIAVMNSITFVEEQLVVDNTLLELELSSSVNHSNNIFSSEIIELKRVDNFFTKKIDDLVKKEMFIQYRNVSPESFLSSLQKYQIGEHEFDLIKSLRNNFHLTNDIINILLDYSISRTHGKVNDIYIEKTARSLNLVGIKTVSEAYNYFYNISTNVKNKKKYESKEEDSLQLIELFN